MADSKSPRSPVAGQPEGSALGAQLTINPVALIRSKPYINALVLAG